MAADCTDGCFADPPGHHDAADGGVVIALSQDAHIGQHQQLATAKHRQNRKLCTDIS